MNYTFSLAPMMDRTDRHFRYFLRLLSPDVLLYTEMVVAQAIVHGDPARHLDFAAAEHPVALQLGGSDPGLLAQAAAIAAPWGYDEFNLNIGCPSDRVQSGSFGACLMAEPHTVAECVSAIQDQVSVPVTVKTRIGIDNHDDYGFLRDFVGTVAASGCKVFVVHARKAILAGLSPAENRTIPPLRYETVYRLKQEFPELTVVINGGIRDTASVLTHLEQVDGVMIGRQAYSEPYWLAELQARLFPQRPAGVRSRTVVLRRMAEYAELALSQGARLNHITRHMLGLYTGVPGARGWRRYLSEEAVKPGAGPEVLLKSAALVDGE